LTSLFWEFSLEEDMLVVVVNDKPALAA